MCQSGELSHKFKVTGIMADHVDSAAVGYIDVGVDMDGTGSQQGATAKPLAKKFTVRSVSPCWLVPSLFTVVYALGEGGWFSRLFTVVYVG